MWAMVVAACGGGAECGPGTTRVDGVCVAADPADPAPVAPTATTSTPTGGGTTTEPGGPDILSVSASQTRVTEGDTLTVTAIVTDPDGIDDLIGGELLALGGATYGAFVTSAQEGAYPIDLPWDELHAVEPIAFERDAPTRELEVRFYDQSGHRASQRLSVELYCDLGSACDGACVDLDTDEGNCGACAATCPIAPYFGDQCQRGACVEPRCTTAYNHSCDDVCGDAGEVCAPMSYGGEEVVGWRDDYSNQCASSVGWWVPEAYLGCGDPIASVLAGGEVSPEGFSEGTPPRPPHELARAKRRGGVPDGNPLSRKGFACLCVP